MKDIYVVYWFDDRDSKMVRIYCCIKDLVIPRIGLLGHYRMDDIGD